MRFNIPYGKHYISNNDVKQVVSALKSDLITQGKISKHFEKALASNVNSKFSSVFNSASSALIAACLALDIKKGDEVWSTSISYVATTNCAIHAGANIKFIDINKKTFNICENKLEEELMFRKKYNKIFPKAVIIVHLAGNPCEMKKIYRLSKKFGFKIIEDASHALGSVYEGSKIGNCKYSDISIFSFHPVKIITSAEGGCATTNSKKIYEKLEMIKINGVTKEYNKFKSKNTNLFYYEQQMLGYNFKLNELQSALGLSQLGYLNKFIQKRNLLASRYKRKLESLPINFQAIDNKSVSAYHLFIIQIEKKYRKKLFEFLFRNSIFVNLHYIPIYKHPYYKKIGFKKTKLDNSEDYYKKSLSLPIYYDLSHNEHNFIISKINSFFK